MTGITTRLILVGALLFASSQQVFPEDSAHIDTRTADEQEIYAVVIRSQMERWIRNAEEGEAAGKEKWQKSTAKSMNFRVFFVSIKGRDPSDSFLRRLHDIPRKIEKRSSARYGKLREPSDKTTHQAGIIFTVEAIRWSNANAAELHGGYWCNGRCGARILSRMQRENGKWAVKGFEMQAIS